MSVVLADSHMASEDDRSEVEQRQQNHRHHAVVRVGHDSVRGGLVLHPPNGRHHVVDEPVTGRGSVDHGTGDIGEQSGCRLVEHGLGRGLLACHDRDDPPEALPRGASCVLVARGAQALFEPNWRITSVGETSAAFAMRRMGDPSKPTSANMRIAAGRIRSVADAWAVGPPTRSSETERMFSPTTRSFSLCRVCRPDLRL